MFEFLQKILFEPAHIFKRIAVMLSFALGLLVLDAFTTFPSISFEHDKYESMQIMSGLLKDSTISKSAKDDIRKEISAIAERKSLRQYYLPFLDNMWTTIAKISHIVPAITAKTTDKSNAPKTNIFLELISWLIFFVYSNGVVLLVYIPKLLKLNGIIKKRNVKSLRLKKRASILAFCIVASIMILINFFVFSIPAINSLSNHVDESLFASSMITQVAVFCLSAIITLTDDFIKKNKNF